MSARPIPLPTNRSIQALDKGPFDLVDIDVYRTHSGEPFAYPFNVHRQNLRERVYFLVVQDVHGKRVADAGFEGEDEKAAVQWLLDFAYITADGR